MADFTYEKKIPLFGSYDVVVVGGGPAGVCAAIEAARNGAKTILVEAFGSLGGAATNSLVGPFMTCYDRDGHEQIVKGLFEEIVERLVSIDGAIHPSEAESPTVFTSYIEKYHHHVTPFNSYALALVLDRMMQENGVEVLLYTRYVDSILLNGKIDTMVFSALEGLIGIQGKMVIDCTGNADVAAASGVKVWKGGENGETAQPGTLFFEVNNADDEAYTARPQYPTKAYRMPEKGAYKINHFRTFETDAANSQSMTRAHMLGREQVLQSLDTLHHTPGFENARLTQVAPVLGVRESRHIDGKYMLTVEDLSTGRVFEDGVVVFGYGMDVHPRKDAPSQNFRLEVAPTYTIPYRSLVPNGCENLLVAGKTICAETQAAGSLRVMPACMAMGQAAGAAAAMAVQKGLDAASVPTEGLREILRAHGAFLQ